MCEGIEASETTDDATDPNSCHPVPVETIRSKAEPRKKEEEGKSMVLLRFGFIPHCPTLT